MKKLVKIIALFVVILVLAVVLLYFVVTSDRFLRSLVLARAEQSMGLRLRAERIELSLFKEIRITGLTAGVGADRFASVGVLHARYRLMPMLKGRIIVDELRLDSVDLTLRQDKDGNFNLPRFPESEEKKPSRNKGPSAALDIALHNIQIIGLRASFTRGNDADPLSAGMSGLNVTLKELRPSQPFVLEIEGEMYVVRGTEMNARVDLLKATITGNLRPDLMPAELAAEARLVLAGKAGAVNLEDRELQIAVAITPASGGYQISRCEIRQMHRESVEGEIRVGGTVGLEPLGANLELHAAIPTSKPLNILGSIIGDYDFGNTTISYDGTVTIDDGGQTIAGAGKALVNALTVTSASKNLAALDPVDIVVEHDLGFARAVRALELEKLRIVVKSQQRKLITVNLDQPTRIVVEDAAQGGTAQISVKTDRLNLAMLKPLLPPDLPLQLNGGSLSNAFDINIRNNGQWIGVRGDISLDDLDLQSGENSRVTKVRLQESVKLELKGFQDLEIVHLQTQLWRASAPIFSAMLTGSMNVKTRVGTFDLKELNCDPAPLQDLPLRFGDFAIDDFDVANTRLSYHGTIDIAEDIGVISARGALSVTDFSLDAPKLSIKRLRPLAIRVEHSGAFTPTANAIGLKELTIQIQDQGRDILRLALRKAAIIRVADGVSANDPIRVSIVIPGVDIGLAVPYIPADVGVFQQGRLVADINASVTLPQLDASAVGMITLTDLTAQLAGTTRALPTVTKTIQFDVGYDGKEIVRIAKATVQIRDAEAELLAVNISGNLITPLDKPGTELNISSAKTIDLYRLEQMVPKSDKSAIEADAPNPKSASPDAKPLWLTANLDFAHLTYKDIDIKKFRGTGKMTGTTVTIDPMKMVVNGGAAELRAVIDLAGPQRPLAYEGRIVTGSIPLKPVLTSFAPRAAGIVDGRLKSLTADFKGQETDFYQPRKTLVANLVADIDAFAISASKGLLASILEFGVLKPFRVSWEDLIFSDGRIDIGVDDAVASLKDITLQNDQLRLHTAGTLEFGGDWRPDFAITPGFRGTLATEVGRSLAEPDAAGFQDASPMEIKSWDVTSLAVGSVSNILESTGVIDAGDAAAVKAGVDAGKAIIEGISGILGGDKKEADDTDGQPKKKKKKWGGFGNLLDDVLKAYENDLFPHTAKTGRAGTSLNPGEIPRRTPDRLGFTTEFNDRGKDR